MAKVTYIEDNGTEHTIDVENGTSLMEAAVKQGIPGIDGDCGGACACATCMVYVPEEWQGKLAKVETMEESMLDFCERREDSSRLSCQIVASDEIDGIRIQMPESQH
ncbi:2Fe-2S iron-sulfur cluster-binding protein [Parvibaculum sp.]|jgi:ferredoxin, 2Fe-2S|uniref:2Fe-2S iron-sulfur cluster-binding protein n=1 Tax=Parvibaculum sp. TaxID=2024848 RepID=UPI000C4EE0BE|nr:2Fe-2S iron-sulfur cluster-binding protein [Parvibaculum sp.]MAM94453.1 2Fe-2S ferredoxin [Parvibaculum sp.]|tara:strand:+ start:21661 stop:21981 length:321 start_codon:yes stop_codon:yes gene_type:complete